MIALSIVLLEHKKNELQSVLANVSDFALQSILFKFSVMVKRVSNGVLSFQKFIKNLFRFRFLISGTFYLI